MIETITLERTGKPPLSFGGELLTQASGQFVNTKPEKPNDNWWQISIYRLDGATEHVVAITYHCEHRGQYVHRHVVATTDPAAAIAAYRPLDVLQGFPPGEVFAARQADLERRALRQWEAITSAVLTSFPEQLPAVKLTSATISLEKLSRLAAEKITDPTARSVFCLAWDSAAAFICRNSTGPCFCGFHISEPM